MSVVVQYRADADASHGKNVVVARGSLVLLDDCEDIEEERAQAVDAAADTQAVAAALIAFTTIGPIVGDRALLDTDTGTVRDIDTPGEPVAAVTAIVAVAADRSVVV